MEAFVDQYLTENSGFEVRILSNNQITDDYDKLGPRLKPDFYPGGYCRECMPMSVITVVAVVVKYGPYFQDKTNREY